MPLELIKRGLKQRSIQILLVLFCYLSLSPVLPLVAHKFLYTLSLLIKDLLLWMMPLTVGFFIAHTVSAFERKAPLLVLTLVAFESLSNFCAVWYSYGFAHVSIRSLPSIAEATFNSDFGPLWRLPFARPAWWSADKGSFLGLALGCLVALVPQETPGVRSLRGFLLTGKQTMEKILTRLFAPMIPVFILGFAAQLNQTELLQKIATQYSLLLFWLILALLFYIGLLFAIGSGFSPKKTFVAVMNLAPAGAVALTSGCSLSTMPWTIEGTSKNLKDPDLARAIIPATTNIQQIGDAICNTFLCFVLFTHFHGVPPSLEIWIAFSFAFVLARFATAAVLGGAIFVMLPIYEQYLHFSPAMAGIILAFNVILDPLVTSTNVIANGALCRIFELVWSKIPKE